MTDSQERSPLVNSSAQLDQGHTPGPWPQSWDYKRLSRNSQCVIAHAVGPQHSCTGVPLDDSEYLQPDRQTMEKVFADAILIAAAPDMLAALKALLEMPSACTTDDEVLENNKRREVAHVIVAKAEKAGGQ